MFLSGRSVNLTTLFLGRLRPPKRLTKLSPITDNCPFSVSGRRNESSLPDRVSYPEPLALESDALPTAPCGPAVLKKVY